MHFLLTLSILDLTGDFGTTQKPIAAKTVVGVASETFQIIKAVLNSPLYEANQL
jgi:hypothetical protein